MGARHSPQSRGYINLQPPTLNTDAKRWTSGAASCRVLTEVSALDGAVVEGDAEVVTCLSQLGNGNAVRAADYPRLVVILPF